MGTVTGDPVNYSAPSLSNSISPEINRGLLTLRQHLVNIPFLFLWTLPASEGINKYSSVERRDVGSRLVLSPQLLGFLPSTVLSLSWHRPEMVMPFDRTFASFPSPALPQQDNFYPFPFQFFSSRILLFSKISSSPIFHPLLFGNERHFFCKSNLHCTQFSTKSETG